jgi:hypothetical protein
MEGLEEIFAIMARGFERWMGGHVIGLSIPWLLDRADHVDSWKYESILF